MFRQKREKPSPEKPFVQIEGEFTEAQLEAVADGLMKLTTFYTSFKEGLMSQQKLKLLATPDKTPPEKPLVELTEAQLEAIAAGGIRLN